MGLFNRSSENSIDETLCSTRDGYVYERDTGIILHVPPNPPSGAYELPVGTKKLSSIAINEMRNSKPWYIIVPGTFKSFNYELINFEELQLIELQEGVEEVKCILSGKNAINMKLPSTIKKIGANNYPIKKDLVLPYGVEEIEQMFASHDTNLISVNIPGTLKVIPRGAFNQCKNLQTVILNEGVETAMLDSFRGTNGLRTLMLPSTFNGTLALSMDSRGVSNVRGDSKYDPKRCEEDRNAILNIKIARDNKVFSFNVKRGEQPTLAVRKNIINIKCASHQQMITIDSNRLESGTYDIVNGILNVRQPQPIQEQSAEQNNKSNQDNHNIAQDPQEQEMTDELSIVYENVSKK